MKTIDKVREFHKVYECALNDIPYIHNEQLNQLRLKLLREEIDELQNALENQNLNEVLDALTDIQYVLDGAFLAFGLAEIKELAFDIVHKSNMSKLENGKPVRRADGKILKGKNFVPPDFTTLLSGVYGLEET